MIIQIQYSFMVQIILLGTRRLQQFVPSNLPVLKPLVLTLMCLPLILLHEELDL